MKKTIIAILLITVMFSIFSCTDNKYNDKNAEVHILLSTGVWGQKIDDRVRYIKFNKFDFEDITTFFNGASDKEYGTFYVDENKIILRYKNGKTLSYYYELNGKKLRLFIKQGGRELYNIETPND